MPTVHTAARLAKTLAKHLSADAKGNPARPFDCFYADVFTVQRKRCWIVIHDPTSFVVLLPGMTAARVKQAGAVLAEALQTQLAYNGIDVPEGLLDDLRDDTRLARTHANRSLIGKLTEAKYTLEDYREDYPAFDAFPWIRVAGVLNEALYTPPPRMTGFEGVAYATPIDFLRAHLGGGRGAGSTDDLPAVLLAASAAPDPHPDDQRAAQMRFYDAMEARTEAEHLRLLRLSLKRDPRNVDALLLRLGSLPRAAQTSRAYALLVDLARARLGEDFERLAGAFWGFHETRPYMRARAELAAALLREGNWPAAREHYSWMLEANLSDNQGVRYLLAPLLLEREEFGRYDELATRYPEDGDAGWTWGKVLAAVLREAPPETLEPLVEDARELNPHVLQLLRGPRITAAELPDSYRFGSEEEAIGAAYALQDVARKERVRVWLAEAL